MLDEDDDVELVTLDEDVDAELVALDEVKVAEPAVVVEDDDVELPHESGVDVWLSETVVVAVVVTVEACAA